MARASETVVRIASTLAAAVCVFTVENIWIDPWVLRRSHNKLPSFVPDATSAMWFLILMALSISVIFLVVCQVLLMRDGGISKKQKWLTGILVFTAAILSVQWFVATSGMTLAKGAGAGEPQKRNVVLRWQASTTPNVRYNIYRGPASGNHPDKLNSAPVEGTSFTDTTAVSGQTYWYAVRAANQQGEESNESSETSVKVP